MKNGGCISEAPPASTLHAPHSTTLLVGISTIFTQYFSGSRLDYSSGGWKYVNVRFGRSLPVPRAGCREEIRVRPTNRRFHNSLWCVSGCKVRGWEGAKSC